MIQSNILLVILVSFVCYIQGQSQCATQHTSGQCISLKKCAKLLKLAEQSNRTNADLILLRESYCGIDKDLFPKVCCEPSAIDNYKEDRRCFTPYGNEGTCRDIYDCPILANTLQSPVDICHRHNIEHLKNHRCDHSADSVCCTTCKPSVGPSHPLTGCCGIDSFNGKPDGKDSAATYLNQYPWLASLEYRTWKNTTKRFCVGALISSKYVLTSGNCVTGTAVNATGKLINVLFGEYDQKNEGPDCVETGDSGDQNCTDGAVRVPIELVIPHEGYNTESVKGRERNDIALLRLRDMVPFTDFIRPICLPSADIPYDDRSIFFAAGWGATERGADSIVKLKVELPYVAAEECNQTYYNYGRVEIWKKQLCAGGVAGKDTCRGDSGGPLMYYNGLSYEIAGVVSFGPTPCGKLNYPGVYTKVYEYLPWIRSQMKP